MSTQRLLECTQALRSPNFSAERVAKFNCAAGKRQTFYRDGKTPGLGLRVTAAGAKTYVFETRLRNRSLRVTIGDERTWSIAAAQKEATRLKTLTDQGLDPRKLKADQDAAEDAARRQLEGDAILVAEAWKAYLNHHAKTWTPKYMESHIFVSKPGGEPKKKRGGPGLTAPGVLTPIMQMRLKDVTAERLTEWVTEAGIRRTGVARTGFELFRTFWRWCGSRPEYKHVIDPAVINEKDLRAAVPPKKSKRFDVLQRSQLKPWFEQVRALPNVVISAFLQALILTGARRDEMASLRWEHVDFKWHSLWIKDKVLEEGRKIPLTPYLSQLLKALPRDSEWVFHSRTAAGGRIREPRSAHQRVLSAAGLGHVSVHGLRRTFASLAEWLEMPRGVVAQLMGHTPTATAERHYINRPLELLAVWHGKYEGWILQQAGVQLRRQKRTSRQTAKFATPRLRLVSSR